MTIPKLTPYTGQVANPDGSQTQTEFTQNMFGQLSYEAQLATELDATIDGMNQAVTDVENNTAAASASAKSAEAAASSAGYKGLWPDTGGSANKGDTYQTQIGGTPTGEYYTALQNTSVEPVGDDVNWKVAGTIGQQNLSDYTDLVFDGVDNMVSGSGKITWSVSTIGTQASTGGTTWRQISFSNPMTKSDFKPLTDVCVTDFGADGASNDTQAFLDAGSFGVPVYCPKLQSAYKVETIETTTTVTYYGSMDGKTEIETVGGINNPMFFNRVTGRKLSVINLTLRGSGLNGVGTANPHFRGAGIWCSAGELEVRGCTISNFSAQAIWTGNISDNWSINVYVDRCDIHHNVISQGESTAALGDCMRLERTNNMSVTHNECSGGLSGIRSQMYCKNINISHNHVYGSYADVGITVAHSTDIRITENNCHHHHSHGIEADSCYRTEIHGNKCHANDSHGILISEYTAPGDPWYEGYIDNVLVAHGETVWPIKVHVHGNFLFDNGKAGMQLTSVQECSVNGGNTFFNNCRLDVNSKANIRVDTTAQSGFVQDVVIHNNNLTQTALCPLAISVGSYQFEALKPVRAYDNALTYGRLCDQPLLGSKNTIEFENPNESANSALVASSSSDFEATNGTIWVLTDPADPGQASLTWDTRVAPVQRAYLFRVRHRGDSTVIKLILQEYSVDSSGVQTFVRTLANTSVSQQSTWKDSTIKVNSSETDDYNLIKAQFVTDDDAGATVYIADAALVPSN